MKQGESTAENREERRGIIVTPLNENVKQTKRHQIRVKGQIFAGAKSSQINFGGYSLYFPDL